MSLQHVTLKKSHYDTATETTIPANVQLTVMGSRGIGEERELCCGGCGIEFWILETKTNPVKEASVTS